MEKLAQSESLNSKAGFDINQVLRGLFKDSDWMFKTGLGGIFVAASIVCMLYSLACLPLVVAFLSINVGYSLRLMRQQVKTPEAKLPEWNDWPDLFVSGLTWIALQSCIWLFCGLLITSLLILASAEAYGLKSQLESSICIGIACLIASCLALLLSFVSSYLMVYFALEENSKAGVAFPTVFKRLIKQPGYYFVGYLLSIGLHWAAIILPILSVLGIFLIPSIYFAGQLPSCAVLARIWAGGQKLEELTEKVLSS